MNHIHPTRRRVASTLLAAVACLGLGLAGCGDDSGSGGASSGGGGGGGGGSGEARRFAFVTNNASDFWTIARAGTEKAKGELENVEVNFQIPGDGTAATQKRIVDDLLARGIDGIAISPVDAANQTSMLNDVAKQTLLITHDSDAPESDRVFYVGTNNVAAGRQAGEVMKQALPDGGKVMLFVGSLDAQNARERQQGIEEVLKGTGIEILDTRLDDTDRARARANAADTITTYPDVDLMCGLWSYNTPAILAAVKEAGKTGEIQIVGFDEEPDTLQGVEDGHIVATIVQQPYEFGYQAIKMMNAYLEDDNTAPADGLSYVETLVIGPDKVVDFRERLNELVGN